MLNQEGSLLDSEGGVGSLGADWSISVPVGKEMYIACYCTCTASHRYVSFALFS